jgi:hypothetical protein
MQSMGLWRWYINITITIVDIIQRQIFYLKYDVSETGFCFHLQVKPTQMGLLYRVTVSSVRRLY